SEDRFEVVIVCLASRNISLVLAEWEGWVELTSLPVIAVNQCQLRLVKCDEAHSRNFERDYREIYPKSNRLLLVAVLKNEPFGSL
ncbi:hypothetical protein R7070_25370, partial [Vibrio sp. 1557]|uniref:hypothetical protein n=1 Tax=Vibrio sp. 1557 TaxID=3074561 RepID=UPI002964C1B2